MSANSYDEINSVKDALVGLLCLVFLLCIWAAFAYVFFGLALMLRFIGHAGVAVTIGTIVVGVVWPPVVLALVIWAERRDRLEDLR